jgi:hypothetical protein
MAADFAEIETLEEFILYRRSIRWIRVALSTKSDLMKYHVPLREGELLPLLVEIEKRIF